MADSLSLIWIVILFLVTMSILAIAIKFSIRKAKEDNKSPQRMALHLGRMRSSFRDAVELIERNIVAHAKRYDIPWVILLHEGLDDTRPALERAEISSVLTPEQVPQKENDTPLWHFFDRGIVIALESDALLTPEGEQDKERRWEEFLALCGKYRPQRPLDSIVISVPVNLLLDQSAAGRAELKRRADLASRRVWIAQNRYAMRFAVYVVIAGGEQLPGFSEFAAALPQAMRSSMLGWSSPYQPATLYQSEWVTQAFDQIEQTVADTTAELFASNQNLGAATSLFLLPARLAGLRTGMSAYLDELMRSNAYHEPFFLRGVYLCGTEREPVFLRDIVEKKVFAEFGLSRAAHSQKLARPLMSRISRWSAIAAIVIFSIGLVSSTIQLSRIFPTLSAGIDGLNRDRQYRARASSMGEKIEFEWYRKTALSLMVGIEQLQARSLRDTFGVGNGAPVNPFMPGSWPIFDDLFSRVQQRIEQEFAELAISTLQQELYRRTADLTQAPLNPAANTLIGSGNDCAAPVLKVNALSTSDSATIAVDNLPEFIALARFASEAQRLNGNVTAMQNLKTTSQSSQSDLHTLVLDSLGADIPGDLKTSIGLFRRASVKETELIDKAAIARALRCAFVKGAVALNQKLFEQNALIESEQRVLDAKNAALAMFKGEEMPSSVEMLAIYRQLIDAIKEQKALLATGDSSWMSHPDLQLGAPYEKLMLQFAGMKLIGPEVVDELRRKSREDYAKTRVQFAALFSDKTDSALAVQTKQNAPLALSKNRQDLLVALEHVLEQPFMAPTAGDALEATPKGTLLNWDNDQLARAAKLGDSRKKYLTDDLPKFPMEMQSTVEEMINYQFSLRLVDIVAHSYSVDGDESLPAENAATLQASFEATAAHLKKIGMLLKEMGQDTEARTLQTIAANDASARLKLLNSALLQARLYSPGEPDSDEAANDRKGTLSVFGAGAQQDLPDYLAHQMAQIETLTAQALVYRAALPPEARNTAELARWSALAKDLELYKGKDPKSSLGKLERFLLDAGREMDTPGCMALLKAHEPARRPANYFAERQQDLHRAITRRCLAMDRRTFAEQWTAFSNDFNRLLKTRRPFIGARALAIKPAEYAEMAVADPSDVGAVLSRLPVVSQDILARSNIADGAILPLRDFASQFSAVRQFMAPLFPADSAQPAGYDVLPKFRINTATEIGGNKIIDWTLSIGEQSIRLRDAPKALRWRPGDSVRLTLRFANDVPLLPRADPDNPYLEVSKKTAVFNFSGTWALLDMIQLLRSNEAPDQKLQTLRLDIPVSAADSKDSQSREKPLRVFLGLSLSEPGKTAPLTWPRIFPERAPVLEKSMEKPLEKALEKQ